MSDQRVVMKSANGNYVLEATDRIPSVFHNSSYGRRLYFFYWMIIFDSLVTQAEYS